MFTCSGPSLVSSCEVTRNLSNLWIHFGQSFGLLKSKFSGGANWNVAMMIVYAQLIQFRFSSRGSQASRFTAAAVHNCTRNTCFDALDDVWHDVHSFCTQLALAAVTDRTQTLAFQHRLAMFYCKMSLSLVSLHSVSAATMFW